MEKINLNKETLRKFGIIMGIAFLVIALIILFRDQHNPVSVYITSLIFFISAVAMPGLLKPIYIAWMKLAFILGWLNTRLILVIIFYLIFIPIGLMIKLFRMDLLDRKIEKGKDSYWKKKEAKDFNRLDYERLF
ncbi:MAG: SxtJ family membrane protein [Candidatus Omnitrophota bacterium]|jgi:hypothetical protein